MKGSAVKKVYGSPKANAGRMPRNSSPARCFNCGCNCTRGEYEVEFWNGYDRCYEAETVCQKCDAALRITQWMPTW